MPEDIGPKIGLTGEAQFTAALKAINAQLRSVDAEMRAVTSAFGENDKATDQLAAKSATLGKAIDTLKSKLGVLQDQYDRQVKTLDDLGKALEKAKKEHGETSEEAGKAQNAYNRQAAEVAKLAAQINDTTAKLNGMQREQDETTAALRDLGNSAQTVGERLDDMGGAADDAEGDLKRAADAAESSAWMEAADQIAQLGDKLLDAANAAIELFNNIEGAETKVSAYFGEIGAAAEKNGALIQNIYNDGVGDTMDGVADALITVKKNLDGLNDTDLENLTKQAITLDELYGIDMNETLRGVNALMTQFGLDGQRAMDYIVAGTQNGLDKTNELGDNLSEYAGKFAQAGYSAEEYFQLLNNGLDGGAYNLDKVNDAINEVTTRLADGTIGDSIKSYSKDTQSLFKAWQKGEATQKQVIDSIVKDIGGAKTQQEALNLAALAFGTMAEDGNLKFITSLTTVGDTYDDVTGSAEGFFDATTTESQKLEGNMRQLQAAFAPLGEKLMELANIILPPIITAVEKVVAWFQSLPEPVQNFVGILGGLIAVMAVVAPIIGAITVAVTALNVPLLPLIAIIAGVAAVIAGVIWAIQNWGTITDWIQEKLAIAGAWIQEKVQAVWDFFQGFDDWLQGIFTTDWAQVFGPGLGDIMNAFAKNLSNIWESIKRIFSGIIDFIGGIFTGDWTRAWEGIKNVFGGIWDGMVGLAKGPINLIIGALNGLISGINFVIRGLNKIHFDIPDWVPGLGGKSFGINIGEIGKIPYLAKGGILYDGTALVGEAGPELLTMDGTRAIVRPLTGSKTAAQPTANITINVYAAEGQSEESIAQRVAQLLQEQLDRRNAVWA